MPDSLVEGRAFSLRRSLIRYQLTGPLPAMTEKERDNTLSSGPYSFNGPYSSSGPYSFSDLYLRLELAWLETKADYAAAGKPFGNGRGLDVWIKYGQLTTVN